MMKRITGRGILSALLISLIVSGGGLTAHGQTATPGITPTPVALCPPDCAVLLAKAKLFRMLNVIVQLKMTVQPESGLSVTDLQTQHAAVQQMQQGVLAQLSATPAAGSLPLFQTQIMYARTPYLVLTVDPSALASLIASPQVARISEDVPGSPLFDLGLTQIAPAALQTDSLATAVGTSSAATPIPTLTSVPGTAQCPPSCDTLIASVKPGSTFSVIVGLKLAAPFALESSLSGAAIQAQRAAIRQAQAALIASLSSDGSAPLFTVTNVYYIQPTLVIKADNATLQKLIASPLVVSLSANRGSSPS